MERFSYLSNVSFPYLNDMSPSIFQANNFDTNWTWYLGFYFRTFCWLLMASSEKSFDFVISSWVSFSRWFLNKKHFLMKIDWRLKHAKLLHLISHSANVGFQDAIEQHELLSQQHESKTYSKLSRLDEVYFLFR